jgi:hypothetical protein
MGQREIIWKLRNPIDNVMSILYTRLVVAVQQVVEPLKAMEPPEIREGSVCMVRDRGPPEQMRRDAVRREA